MDSTGISRRRFIRSAAVTITLPLLPSLLYTRRGKAEACKPVKRFVGYMFANGHHMAEHVPPLPDGTGPTTSFNVSGDRWQLPRFTPWDRSPTRWIARLVIELRNPQ